MEHGFVVEVDGPVAQVRLDRPEVGNALGAGFWGRFGATVRDLDRTGHVRALVISGEGRHFCTGMDLTAFATENLIGTGTPALREAFQHVARDLQDTLAVVERSRFPVIAAVHGACVGAGLELVAACDLRVASQDARFRIEEINIGMMADVGSLQRLPRLLPDGVVREMAYMGSTLTAERAAALGFVRTVAPDPVAALDVALGDAQRIAAKAPLAVAGSKAALRYARDHSVDDGLAWGALANSAWWNPDDVMAAVAARRTGDTPTHVGLAPVERWSERR